MKPWTPEIEITLTGDAKPEAFNRPMIVIADLANRCYSCSEVAEITERMIAAGTKRDDLVMFTLPVRPLVFPSLGDYMYAAPDDEVDS